VRGQVAANEVLWIGDSWVLVPGSQRTRLRDLARIAGALGSGEDYVNAAAPATTMSAIANQYSNAQAGATKTKVVLMDGGTWDTIGGGGSAASVNAASNAFSQFINTVRNDGTVQHIIYFLTPELPGIPGVAALRPLLQQTCAQSTVPCHFLDLQNDLQPPWAPEYASGEPIPVPTDAGGRAIAEAIWKIMQQACIAQ
jgi:hypothetical protein